MRAAAFLASKDPALDLPKASMMTLKPFNIVSLPIELFRAIIAEAMRVRRLKRAKRLRLVSST